MHDHILLCLLLRKQKDKGSNLAEDFFLQKEKRYLDQLIGDQLEQRSEWIKQNVKGTKGNLVCALCNRKRMGNLNC